MRITRLLIANRGEIAIRIARTAADLGIRTVGVFAEDDTTSLHCRHVDDARGLRGSGPRAYLDAEQLLAVACDAGCDAVHPGYAFLSEQAASARRCADTGLVFVGPRAETLALLGDKVAARALAARCGGPVPRGTDAAVSLDEARVFIAALGPDTAVVVKAVAGGGGRGLRVVRRPDELDDAWARCRSEAQAAFGDDALYVEELLPRVRHVEVRVNCETLAADGSVRPSTGVLGAFDVPTGPGVRVDTAGYAGYRPSTSFDSLLAKVVVRNTATDFAGVVAKTCRALSEFRTDGVSTNLPFLRNLLRHPALATFAVTTRSVEEHLHELLVDDAPQPRDSTAGRAGASVDPHDPLAVLVHGKTASVVPPVAWEEAVVVRAPMQGTVVA